MDSKRQNKVSKQIQKDLGEIFQRGSVSLFNGAMITVTKVYVTGDLSIAKAYLSLFATKDKSDLLNSIRHNTPEIRHQLGRRIKNQMRKVPELRFYEDDSLDYIDNIENILNQ